MIINFDFSFRLICPKKDIKLYPNSVQFKNKRFFHTSGPKTNICQDSFLFKIQ